MVLRITIFILLMSKNLQTDASGFDAYSSCYRTSRKRQELPCDFGSQSWCTIPGNSYPWHAVRRFVHENQGLMRRMYGDERHISVLRAELESNDIDFFSSPSIKEEFRRRYSKDIDGTKDFVKMFRNEARKLYNDPKTEKGTKVEKIQKSIEEKSSNLFNQNYIKNSKVEELKNPVLNKTQHKTTTSPATTNVSTVESPVTVPTNPEITTTEPINSTPTSSVPGVDTTLQPTTKQASNMSMPTASGNDTIEEDFDYGLETEEIPTTTNDDGLTTTEAEFEEEENPKDKDNDEEALKEVELEEQETIEEPTSPKPSPMIRLKGINACPVKEEVVAPFWANNTRGEVLALLNLYPFEQYVHWEKCTYEHKQMFCREGCRCEQQYRLHRLLAYDPNNECRGIFSDWFRFPSCCVCKCYDLPMEFRLTSRSPRIRNFDIYENLFNQKRNP